MVTTPELFLCLIAVAQCPTIRTVVHSSLQGTTFWGHKPFSRCLCDSGQTCECQLTIWEMKYFYIGLKVACAVDLQIIKLASLADSPSPITLLMYNGCTTFYYISAYFVGLILTLFCLQQTWTCVHVKTQCFEGGIHNQFILTSTSLRAPPVDGCM